MTNSVQDPLLPLFQAETSCLGGFPGGGFNGGQPFVSNGCAVDDPFDCDCDGVQGGMLAYLTWIPTQPRPACGGLGSLRAALATYA